MRQFYVPFPFVSFRAGPRSVESRTVAERLTEGCSCCWCAAFSARLLQTRSKFSGGNMVFTHSVQKQLDWCLINPEIILFGWNDTLLASPAESSGSCLQEQRCIISQGTYQQLCWVTENGGSHRLSHWRLWQRGWLWGSTGLCLLQPEEVESLKRDSCSFPTPMAYERSQRHRSSFYQPGPPASHREGALATHVEVTEGKYSQEKGQCLGFYSQSFQGGRLVLCCGWRLGGGVGEETEAKMDHLSGQLTHVVTPCYSAELQTPVDQNKTSCRRSAAFSRETWNQNYKNHIHSFSANFRAQPRKQSLMLTSVYIMS